MATVNGWLQPTPEIPVRHIDLSGHRGNGPFNGSHQYLGWILHVNVGNTPVTMFEAGPPSNPNLVTPTIQVYKSAAEGGIVQFLPLNCQPWCQINGNFNYGAAETAGFPNEVMTDFQLDALAYFAAESHRVMGMELAIADQPGQKGIGTHVMGGLSWGGHTCPGPGPRAAQRTEIIRRANALLNPPSDLLEEIMALDRNSADYKAFLADVVNGVAAKVLPNFNVDHDGNRHSLGTWLYGVPGYVGPADRQHAAAAKPSPAPKAAK